MVVILGAVASSYQFLPPSTEYGDGFSVQLATAGALVNDGAATGLLDESLLPLLHVVRLVVVAPFLAVEEVSGPAGSVALLLLLIWPLTRVPGSTNRSLFTLMPLAMPMLVSGRGALVAVAVGYVVMHMLERRRSWMLWIGALLANLSSASVLMSLVLLAAGRVDTAYTRLPRSLVVQRTIVFGLLLVSFSLSALDKFAGFSAGDQGYDAYAFDTDNVLLRVISRSTLAVSVVEGQHLRALVYGTIAALLLVKLIIALFDQRRRTARRILLCCAPSIFMEGLGVLAMVFPMLWLLRGFPADARKPPLPVFRTT